MTDVPPLAPMLVVAALGGMLVAGVQGCSDPIDERLRRADKRLQTGDVAKATSLAEGVLDEAPRHWAARLTVARADLQRGHLASAEERLAALEREAVGGDGPQIPGLTDDGFVRARRVTRRLYDRWSREIVPAEGSPTRTDDEAVDILKLAYALAPDPDGRRTQARRLAEVWLARSARRGAEAESDSRGSPLSEAARWAPPDTDIRERVLAEWKSRARRAFRAEWIQRKRLARVHAGVWNGGGDGAFERIESTDEMPSELTGKGGTSWVWRGTFDVPVDRKLAPHSDAELETARATAEAHLVGRLRRVALALIDLPTETDLNKWGRQRAIDALLSGVAKRDVVINPGRAEVTAWLTGDSLRKMAFELKWLLETRVHGRTLGDLQETGCVLGGWVLEVIRRGRPDTSEAVSSADACRRRRRAVRDSETFNLEQMAAECVCRVDS